MHTKSLRSHVHIKKSRGKKNIVSIFLPLISLRWIKESAGVTVVVKTHKHTSFLSAPLKPVPLSCALLSPILLCSSVHHQRYFPAVRNRLTNHKKNMQHLLAYFQMCCDTTTTYQQQSLTVKQQGDSAAVGGWANTTFPHYVLEFPHTLQQA